MQIVLKNLKMGINQLKRTDKMGLSYFEQLGLCLISTITGIGYFGIGSIGDVNIYILLPLTLAITSMVALIIFQWEQRYEHEEPERGDE